MLCPFCNKDIAEEEICPFCGNSLQISTAIGVLKKKISDLDNLASSLQEGTKGLQQRLSGVERLMFLKKNFAEEKPQKEKKTIVSENTSIVRDKITPAEKPKSVVIPPPLPNKSQLKIKRVTGIEREVKLGQKWLLIAGVILSVLGVGWFLKYSFDRNWVGPAGRIAMAYLMGGLFLGGGEYFRRRKFDIFGLYLIGGGIATLYLATFSSFQLYHLFSQLFSFGLMILITTLAGTLALFYNSKWLAVLGLIGGFVTPILIRTVHSNEIGLMSYVLILNIGILTITFFKQWKLLTNLGFFFTWLLFTGWYIDGYSDKEFFITFIFLTIFFLIYALVPFAYHLLREVSNRLTGYGVSIPNSFIAFGYSYAMIDSRFRIEYVSIVSLFYAFIFLIMSTYVYKNKPSDRNTFILLLGKAMLFLILTVPILFTGHWITLFWSIQMLILFWLASKLQNRWLYSSAWILLAMTIWKFILYDYPVIFRIRYDTVSFKSGFKRLVLERLISLFLLLAALFQSARFTNKIDASILFFKNNKDKIFIWTIAILSLFSVLNIEIAGFFHDYVPQARFAALSVLWAFFSLSMISIGFIKNIPLIRQAAIFLFSITLLKVFLLDIGNLSTPYRIISFLVLGLLLISASWLYHRFKELLLPDNDEEKL